MDLIAVANQIEKKIKLLESAREKLKEYAEDKAKTLVEYEKNMGITMVGLKHGRKYAIEHNGENLELECTSATNVKDIAKAVCHTHSLNMSVAEARYKNCVIQIEAIKAELNGYQSIFRHLESM